MIPLFSLFNAINLTRFSVKNTYRYTTNECQLLMKVIVKLVDSIYFTSIILQVLQSRWWRSRSEAATSSIFGQKLMTSSLRITTTIPKDVYSMLYFIKKRWFDRMTLRIYLQVCGSAVNLNIYISDCAALVIVNDKDVNEQNRKVQIT